MGTAGLGLMAVIAAMYYRGEMLAGEAVVKGLQNENNTLIAATETIKEVNARVNKTLDFTLEMHKDQLGKADEYRSQLTTAENETQKVILELDDLKRTEHKRALEKPFERGNAAHDRIVGVVCRAWGDGANNPQCRSEGNTGDASTNDRDKNKSGTDADSSTSSGNNTKRSEVLP